MDVMIHNGTNIMSNKTQNNDTDVDYRAERVNHVRNKRERKRFEKEKREYRAEFGKRLRSVSKYWYIRSSVVKWYHLRLLIENWKFESSH